MGPGGVPPDPDPALLLDLERLLSKDRVLARPLDRLARSVDASLYRLIPQAVVRPKDLDEVRGLLAWARRRGAGLTFRTAGTSLSGQAVTDQVLVELAPHWGEARVLDDGARVWSQPGVVGGHLNRMLAPYERRIGPDPASIDSAMLGGILSNNSSGMCCGVVENSYRTLDALRFVLADGTLVDTSHSEADDRLRRARPGLHAELRAMRDEVRADEALAALVRRKFSRKNTTGYSLNAFLDFDSPVEILAHLMVGAEGTLGFIADATLRSVPDPPSRATALLYFGDLAEAGAAIAPLAEAGAAALEIMDAACLRAQGPDAGHPVAIRDGSAAILAEVRTADPETLPEAIARAEAVIAGLSLLAPAPFTRDPAERDRLWKLRKGIIPLVGGARPPGTACLIEDVAVPVERLAEAIRDLQALFGSCGLRDSVVFGHAKDGNLHFVLVEDFSRDEVVERYDRFMRELAELIAGRYEGSLKAEHGCGRNMAPFVRREWGDAAYALMRRLKRLLDPDGILNPGVLLNDDPDLHVKNLKSFPEVAPEVDRCIECGFCEPRCPSRMLTLSPRQRIVVERERTRLGAQGGEAARDWLAALERDFEWEGRATCAGDGMCQTSCPVSIDTGAMVKAQRERSHSALAQHLALQAAAHFGLTARGARLGLGVAALARRLPGGAAALELLTGRLHDSLPEHLPRLRAGQPLPRPAPPLPGRRRAEASAERRVVYLPSCLTRVVGPLEGEPDRHTARQLVELLGAAGWAVRYPPRVASLCCGMPFSSKGHAAAARRAACDSFEALWAATREGRDPVVTDASPCAATLAATAADAERSGRAIRVMDFPAFWAREALPGMPRNGRRPGTAVLHPTCSLIRAGGLPDLVSVAQAHAERVWIPPSAECCGFAGDRGLLVPELTEAATRREAAEVRARLEGDPGAGLFSTCRTCEIGMTRAVEEPYAPLVSLVHEAVLGRG